MTWEVVVCKTNDKCEPWRVNVFKNGEFCHFYFRFTQDEAVEFSQSLIQYYCELENRQVNHVIDRPKKMPILKSACDGILLEILQANPDVVGDYNKNLNAVNRLVGIARKRIPSENPAAIKAKFAEMIKKINEATASI